MFLALTRICIPHTFVLCIYCKDSVCHMCVAALLGECFLMFQRTKECITFSFSP